MVQTLYGPPFSSSNIAIKIGLLVLFHGDLVFGDSFRGKVPPLSPVWRDRELRRLLLEFFIYDLTALVAAPISITLDEGSDTFILAQRNITDPSRAGNGEHSA